MSQVKKCPDQFLCVIIAATFDSTTMNRPWTGFIHQGNTQTPHTPACAHTHEHAHFAHSHTHKHKRTLAHAWHTHTHTRTHTNTHTEEHTHTPTRTHTLKTHKNARRHTHTHSYARTHTCILTCTHKQARTQERTPTHTHSHAQTHTHTHTQGIRIFEEYEFHNLLNFLSRTFYIAPDSYNYRLTIGGYEGNTTDEMASHPLTGMMFTTLDSDNDIAWGNCASFRGGAWWYNHCTYSNLNGKFGVTGDKAISWGSNIMKFVEMKIRKRQWFIGSSLSNSVYLQQAWNPNLIYNNKDTYWQVCSSAAWLCCDERWYFIPAISGYRWQESRFSGGVWPGQV